MIRTRLLLVLSIIIVKIFAQDENQPEKIAIGFLLDSDQDDVPVVVAKTLKEVQLQLDGRFSLNDYYIRVDRDNFNDSRNFFCQTLFKGINAIIDVTVVPWNDFKELITIYKIPYVHVDLTIKPFVSALTKYLDAKDAHDAVFIFQNERELNEGLYQILQDSTLKTVFYNGIDEEVSKQLKMLRPVPSYYAMFASTENLKKHFQQAIKYNLVNHEDKWNLVFLDFQYEQFDEHLNYPALSLLTPKKEICCKLRFSTADDCQCDKDFKISNSVLSSVIKILLNFITTNKQFPIRSMNCDDAIVVTDEIDLAVKNFYDHLRSVTQLSSLVLFDKDQVTYTMNMTVFSENSENPGNVVDIAHIDNSQLYLNEGQEITSTKRYFRIGITEAIPWTFIKRDPVNHETVLDVNGLPIWEGYCIDLIQKLSEVLNFDYELVLPQNGTFGKRLSNNDWDGLVGDLITGETDIAVAALKMTAEREEVIDFIAPYFEQTGISIVIRQPVRQTSLFKFMTVLRLEVWLSIVGALVATAIMIWLLDKYSPYSARNNKEAYPYACREFSLKECFWFALTSFTPQGGGEAPKALSGRTMVAAYWLFVVLMLATFTANLAAFLTVERMQTPVQSLDQLARQSRINYTVVEGSDTHKYFINMKFAEDTLYRVWKEITLNSTNDQERYRVWDYPIREQYGHILLSINTSNPVRDAIEGFHQVNIHENADFAFIHDSAEIKYELTRNCNLTEVGEVFAEQPYAVGVQQGSNLQDELSRAILDLEKDRFLEGLTMKYWNQSAKGLCKNTDDSEGITLESLGGVFIATLFGLALAIITLIGEVIYYRRKHNNVSEFKDTKPTEKINKFSPKNNNLKIKEKEIPDDITFGKEFVPAAKKQNVSYISVYPRKSIHGNLFD